MPEWARLHLHRGCHCQYIYIVHPPLAAIATAGPHARYKKLSHTHITLEKTTTNSFWCRRSWELPTKCGTSCQNLVLQYHTQALATTAATPNKTANPANFTCRGVAPNKEAYVHVAVAELSRYENRRRKAKGTYRQARGGEQGGNPKNGGEETLEFFNLKGESRLQHNGFLTHRSRSIIIGKYAQLRSRITPSRMANMRTVLPRENASNSLASCGAMKPPATPFEPK